MKKIFKALFSLVFALTAIFAAAFALFLIIPTDSELNLKSLDTICDYTTFYDRHNDVIQCVSSSFAPQKAEEIPDVVKKAFIASEDKNFYNHNGLDYLRMVKAFFVNIKDGKFSQGASTISQQLVKNTQLSNEKTILRKLKEIKLTQKLESLYTKDEILFAYLNGIYFGDNNYGIESAARYYFNKSTKELTLAESAMLAATIRSPSKCNPHKNVDILKTKQRAIIDKMSKLGMIDDIQAENAKNEEVRVYCKTDDYASPYLKATYDELIKLSYSPYEIRKFSVFTDYDDKLQRELYELGRDVPFDEQFIVCDNATHLVNAYYSTCGEISRSPASTIKPIAVYAPSIDLDVVTQYTTLNDEPTTIDGYSIENYNDKYYGDVTVRDALKLSLNVPSVKLLNAMGTETAAAYLKKMDIYTNNRALNLGVGYIEEGTTIKNVCSAYCTFACDGEFSPFKYIRKIVDENGEIIYENKNEKRKVFSESTASIITDVLKECAKSGTAKKLKDIKYDVAAKTGTFGNEKGNSDSYSISYTTDKTIGVWIGNADGSLMPNEITGGGLATVKNRDILNAVYEAYAPSDFVFKGVCERKIDGYQLRTSGKIELASDNTPEKYVLKGLFKEEYPILQTSDVFVSPKVTVKDLSFIDGILKIELDKRDICRVKIYKKDENGKLIVYDGYDDTFSQTLDPGEYEFSIVPVVKGKNEVAGKEITLPKITNGTVTTKLPDIPSNWWFD